MRAAWHSEFGAAADVLNVGDFATPEPAAGEVLVRVHASGINPLDVKKRAGARGALGAERAIPHYDGAGVIAAVGDGVDAGRVGQRVWLFEGQFGRWLGTAAEYIALPASRANPLPNDVSFAAGACLGIPAMTAHRALCADGPVSGQTVLVTGAAGAVGSFAVQFAAHQGATVIGTVSSDAKAAQARADGAAHTINYKAEDVVARVMELTDGAGVDRVVEVELGGNMAVTTRILKANAVVAAYASMAVPEATVPFYPLLRTGPTIQIVACFTVPEAAKLAGVKDISDWLAAGALRHHVGASFALDDIARAHEAVESGQVIGGVVVEI